MGRRSSRRSQARRRLAVMGGVISLACLLLVARLTQVQLLGGQRYVAYGSAQMNRVVTLAPQRGPLLDRNGNVLAMSLPVEDVYADPHQVKNASNEAQVLSPLLHVPRAVLLRQLKARTSFVYLARQVSAGVSAAIRAKNLPGINFLPDSRRFAPDGNLALPVLGFTGLDNQGLAGLEYKYNSLLAGKPGQAVMRVNPWGTPITGGLLQMHPAMPGRGLRLTLDTAIQYETEQALSQEIVASHARSGMAVIEDSATGQILSMASLVASPHGPPQPAPSNFPVTYTYEPGSVMKLSTFSGALGAHIITPSTPIHVPSQLVIAGSVFHDAEPHGPEVLTATQVLAQSSNMGTIKIAERLGAHGVSHWIRAFGFGSHTGLGFPGASTGIVRPVSTWSATAIGSTPIGQDTGVTAMQVLDAYNVLANGGVFVPPRLVQGTVTGSRFQPLPPPPRHRVVAPWVAATMTQMLRHVATNQGTAPAAAIPGYTVAGKTGTAQKPLTNGRGYIPGAFMGTFVGYVPAQHPVLTAVVVLDRPTPIYGGSVAAPVFAKICGYALRLMDVPPTSSGTSSGTTGAGAG